MSPKYMTTAGQGSIADLAAEAMRARNIDFNGLPCVLA